MVKTPPPKFEILAAEESLEFFATARDALAYAHDVAAQTRQRATIIDAHTGLGLLIVAPSDVGGVPSPRAA